MFLHYYFFLNLTGKEAQNKLSVTLGSILGTVALIAIIWIAVLLLCFIVPSCPMQKLYSQRYTELSNDSEYDLPNSVPEDEDDPFFGSTTDYGHSSPPPYVSLSGDTDTLNITSADDSPTSSTPATNAGPHTVAVGQPTGSNVMQVVN